MASFQDATGRAWRVRISVETLRRVKSDQHLQVDLLELAGGPLLGRLASDPVLLGDLLATICEKEITDRGLTEAEFGELLAGDTIDAATEALLSAMVDFLPESRRRLLSTARDKMRTAETATIRRAQALIDAIDPEQIATQATTRPPSPPTPSSAPVTSTPAYLASTPHY